MNLEVFNETDEDLNFELKELQEFLEKTCKDEGLVNGEFNVIIVGEEKIKELNREYRNIDKVTDVISFALEDDNTFKLDDYRVLGDIYICINRAREQAIEYGHSFKRELSFLAIHGLLHLLGYDHMNKDEEEVMFSKQEEVLKRYGIER